MSRIICLAFALRRLRDLPAVVTWMVVLLACSGSEAQERPAVKLNEILFDPAGADGGKEWLELFNGDSKPVSLGGWTVARGDGRVLATLPDQEIPLGGYLVVRFGPGQDDADWSDGQGTFHAGQTDEVLSNSRGEIGLYRGPPSAEVIVDFMAYAFDLGEGMAYSGGKAHDQAVEAMIWTKGAAFAAAEFVIEGNSIGRDPLASDHDEPHDWYGDGGVQASGPSPGRINESPLGYVGDAQITALWPLLAFGEVSAKKAQAAQDMLLKVLDQIRKKHMDLLGRNGDAGLGDAAPVIQAKADGKGGQKGDIVVGNVRFRFVESLTVDGKTAGGAAYAPDKPDGEVRIELNLSALDDVNDADKPIGNMVEWKLKEVVIHELAHAAHYHDLKSGYWRTESGKTEPTSETDRKKIKSIDEMLAYLTNLDLLRRLMDEFPRDQLAGIEERYVGKVKIVIQHYLTNGAGGTPVTEVIEGFKGVETERHGDHLRDQVLEQVRNLLRHKIYSFLILNRGGPLTAGQRAELATEMKAFNGVTPASGTQVTNEEVVKMIEEETEAYKGKHPPGQVDTPPPNPVDEVTPEEKRRLGEVRAAHKKLKDELASREEYVTLVEGYRKSGNVDDKMVEAGKKARDEAKEKLKEFEDANEEDLKKLKIKRVTSLGATSPRTAKTLATEPARTFQTIEGQQAYAVLEQFAATGDLRAAVHWGDEITRHIETLRAESTGDASSLTLTELARVVALSELIDTASKSLISRVADLKRELATNGGTAEGIVGVFSGQPPVIDVAIPEPLTGHVVPRDIVGTVFDQFTADIVRQATASSQPGAQVTKGGAVMDGSGPHSAVATVKITFEETGAADPGAPMEPTTRTDIVKTDAAGRFEVTVPAGSTVSDLRIASGQLGETSDSQGSLAALALQLEISPEVWTSSTLAERVQRLATGHVMLDAVRRQVTGEVHLPLVEDLPVQEWDRALLEDVEQRQLAGQFVLERILSTGVMPGAQPEWLSEAIRQLAESIYSRAIDEESARRKAALDEWLATTSESVASGGADSVAVREALADEARSLAASDQAYLDLLRANLAKTAMITPSLADEPPEVSIPSSLHGIDVPVLPTRVVVVTRDQPSSDGLSALTNQLESQLRSAVGSNELEFTAVPMATHAAPRGLATPGDWAIFEFTVRGPDGRVASVDGGALQGALDAVRSANPSIVAIELAQIRSAEAVNDPHFRARGGWGQEYADQWAIRKIGIDPTEPASAEWIERLPAGAPCVVAVIGSGVDWTHPELLGQMWVNTSEHPYNGVDDDDNGFIDDQFGWNFRDDAADVLDHGGHDTHVAGVIGARWNNGRGIAGVNPRARIMALKAANYMGQSNSIDIGRALFYAVDQGARVVNISYSGATPSAFEQLAVEYAVAQGVLVVVAVGNQAADAAGRGLASAGGVLTVAGVGVDGVRAPFSNWGQPVSLTAPSMDVLGLRARGTDFLLYVGESPNYVGEAAVVGRERDLYRASGTSFAAPLVSGAASLLFSSDPRSTATDVRRRLLMSAGDLDVPGWDQNTGVGLVNVRAAFDADPGKYLAARITQVRAVRREGRLAIEVSGVAEGSSMERREVQIAFGTAPRAQDWVVVDTSEKRQESGVLAYVSAQRLNRRGTWSIRVLAMGGGGLVREARATIDTQ